MFVYGSSMRICLLLLLWLDNRCCINAERHETRLVYEGTHAAEQSSTVEGESRDTDPEEGERGNLLCPSEGPLNLDHFTKSSDLNRHCYHRQMRAGLSVVDMHLHPRPFNGPPVPFHHLMEILSSSGVLFAVLNGIGQRLPIDSPCSYYLDPRCVGNPDGSGVVTPKFTNDVVNAQSFLDWTETQGHCDRCGPHIVVSMTFPDLAKPEEMAPGFDHLMDLYPNLFKWAGEINVVKQALWNNSAGKPVEKSQIDAWAPFMKKLEEHNIPLALHCDVGNNANPAEFLHLMQYILDKYGETNTIIWVHLGGLSKELEFGEHYEMHQHATLIEGMLSKYSRLMIDLSWTVLFNNVWYYKDTAQVFIDLVNKFPRRFLPGTDFVAAASKGKEEYNHEHLATCHPYLSISDKAFRRIALGQNYFEIAGINSTFQAPRVCPEEITPACIRYAQEMDEDEYD